MTGETPDHTELRRRFEAMIAESDLDDLRRLTVGLPTTGRPRLRKARRSAPVVYRLRVDLEDAQPPIWRRLEVRSDVTLDVVHGVLQAAFGWTDSHLHRFALGGNPFDLTSELFLCPYDAEEGEEEGTPASEVTLDETLAEPGDRLSYVYDYGDSWDLRIDLEAVVPLTQDTPIAICTDGRRAAPPEDCGGLRDAEELATVIGDPAHFDVADVNRAFVDPCAVLRAAGVDAELVDLLERLDDTRIGGDLLRAVATQRPVISVDEQHSAMLPILWFLDRVGEDGLPLTSAGYLKPDDVLALSEVLPNMADWIGSRNREVHSAPVLKFREALQRLGLTRKYKGRLLLTKLGAGVRGDAAALWDLLAQRLPFGKADGMERQAGLLVLAYALAGLPVSRSSDRIAAALHYVGWRYPDGGAVDGWAVHRSTDPLTAILRNVTAEPIIRTSLLEEVVSQAASALAYDALRS
jgi:hypothetical protein